MTEIKKTLSILKARWPEVTLIISFHLLTTISSYLPSYLAALTGQLPKTFFMYIAPGSTLLIILILIFLNAGFLRTVYLENSKRQSAVNLFRVGRHFFWRILLFNLLYTVPFLILSLLMIPLVKNIIPQDFRLVQVLSSTGLMLILIKFSLLIPILIIVLDCKLLESFRILKRYKLSKAKVLILLFILSMVIGFSWTFIPRLGPNINLILSLAWQIITSFIGLMIGVTAIRFVSSVDLIRDNRPTSQYLENEPE